MQTHLSEGFNTLYTLLHTQQVLYSITSYYSIRFKQGFTKISDY